MPPKNSASVHDDDGHTDLHLAYKSNAERIDQLDKKVDRYLRSASRNFWVAVIQTGLVFGALAGGGTWMYVFRSEFNTSQSELRAEVKGTNERLERTNETMSSLQLTTALMQKDLQPIEQLRTQILELQLEVERLKIKNMP